LADLDDVASTVVVIVVIIGVLAAVTALVLWLLTPYDDVALITAWCAGGAIGLTGLIAVASALLEVQLEALGRMTQRQRNRAHAWTAVVVLGVAIPLAVVASADDLGLPPVVVPISIAVMVGVAIVTIVATLNDPEEPGRTSDLVPTAEGCCSGCMLVPVIAVVLWLSRSSILPWWEWLISHFGY
jgi:hypothetical protein